MGIVLRLIVFLDDTPSPDGLICSFHGDRHKLATDMETRQFLPVDLDAGSFALIAVARIRQLEFERIEDESAEQLRRLTLDLDQPADASLIR